MDGLIEAKDFDRGKLTRAARRSVIHGCEVISA